MNCEFGALWNYLFKGRPETNENSDKNGSSIPNVEYARQLLPMSDLAALTAGIGPRSMPTHLCYIVKPKRCKAPSD
jgi:hypothetical protein